MKNTKPIYIIGHRNPDTDSICSAIGYAHLKQALGENVVAARAGKVNADTKYALEYFHKVITHFFLLKDILENIAAVLCHRRICIQTRHHVLDVVLFPLLC